MNMSNIAKTTILDELCVCGQTEDDCECALGFCSPEDADAVVQANPPNQQKCYCQVVWEPGFGCALVEWRPDDPEAFQVSLIKKIFGALRGYWGEPEGGHLSLDLDICPAEALWIAKSLKANIRKQSIKAAKA
jgi:hypothetical protein